MEGLSFDNILGEHDIETLFMDDPEETSAEEQQEVPNNQEKKPDKGENKNNETNKTTEVVDPDSLFEEEEQQEEKESKQSESVGSEKETEEEGGAATEKGSDTSPKDFYSSIANALVVDGILPNSDEEAANKVTDAESLGKLIEDEVNSRFDEKQQRLIKALENGVPPVDIRMYENTLKYLDSIDDAALSEEGEAGEELRRQIIFQDLRNKGYSKERAQKMTERSFEGGNDIDDAKEAYQSNKEYFQEKYDELLEEAQRKADEEKANRKKQEESLREGLINDKHLAGKMEITKDVRKKALDLISKPVYKDSDGNYLTAIQKYQAEHPVEFLKYVGLFMAMTDNFSDFDPMIAPIAKKEQKKGLRELEDKLNNTKRNSNGSLKMVTSVKEDPDSYYSGDIKLVL